MKTRLKRTGTFVALIVAAISYSEAQLSTTKLGQDPSKGGKGTPTTTTTSPTVVTPSGIPQLPGTTPPPTGNLPGADRSVKMDGSPSSITFSNHAGSSVTAYWVDFNGINKEIGTLFPKQAVQITTYPGYVIVFTANGQQVAKYTASKTASVSAYAIVGKNNPAGVNGSIPQTSVTIPSVFQGSTGGLSSSQLGSDPIGQSNVQMSNLGNFISSLSTVVPSNSYPGVGTSNQFLPSNQRSGGLTNLAAILNSIANLKGGTGATGGRSGSGIASPANLSAIETAILNATNVERAKRGLGALASSGPAANLARQHSVSQMATGNLTHNGMQQRLTSAASTMGITYAGGSENVAQNNNKGNAQATGKAIVDAWMTSTGHRKNILDSRAKHLGVGVATNPANGEVWATQLFLY